jgi:cyclic dehypoxanthinyl futalosine synthase
MDLSNFNVKKDRLSPSEAADCFKKADRYALAACADQMRKRYNPADEISYLVDRNINYTNVCTTDCLFCGFYRTPKNPEGYVLSKAILTEKLTELRDLGGSRVLLQGGHNPDLKIQWYEELFSWMREKFPSIQIDALSPSEIDNICVLEDLSTKEVLIRLQKAGMAYLPGGGAEMLVDSIRQKISKKKISAKRWIDIMDVAQSLGLGTSASMVIGVDETLEQRIEHFELLRVQQDKALARGDKGFSAFIMWPMLLDNNLGKVLKRTTPIAVSDYLNTLAMARIYLDNFEHIQASWPTMGPEIAEIALHWGADSIGSTMMEENVVSQSGAVHNMMSEELLRLHIKKSNFKAIKRDSNFKALNV